MPKGKLFIGTSGWVYSHWKGVFYPKDLSQKDKLKYFSQHFKTTEINYSFYRLPSQSVYQNWYSQTPENFLFALKASRFITHIKRLKGVKKDWKIFIKNGLTLKEKLGPILFQFPPTFKATEENIKRLDKFLTMLKSHRDPFSAGLELKYAFEFRDKSWRDEKIYKLLKQHKAAWVIADSPCYPRADIVAGDFVYIRMHGSKVLFSSKYTKKELSSLSGKIKKWLKQGKDVYVYFNNDACGYALKNAKELIKLCKNN